MYGSDATSSLAYSPDQILLTLALAGSVAYGFAVPVALAVAVVLLVVAVSYRLTLQEYPTSGGDYEVVRRNLGSRAALVVAGAILADYVLVVSVSVSAAVYYAATLVDWVSGRETIVAAGTIVLLTVISLRGNTPRRVLGALPVYVFVAAVVITVVWGWVRVALGDVPMPASADYVVEPVDPYTQGLTGVAAGVLVLRAFSVGAVSLTGVQTIVSSVGRFRAPRAAAAGWSLMLVAGIGAVLLVSVVALARRLNVQIVEDVSTLTIDGAPAPEGFRQNPVLEQLANAVMVDVPGARWIVGLTAVVVLLLATLITYEVFPGLASVLARDGFLPRQMHLRGDRLTFSVAIVILAVAAIAVVVLFQADVLRLVNLYVVGVFIAFTVSQAAMVRHFTRRLAEPREPDRGKLLRSRVVSAVGTVLTGAVLLVLLFIKTTRGAWLVLVLVAAAVLLMLAISRHYRALAEQIHVDSLGSEMALPPRVHVLVLTSRIDKPTLRAIAYARGTGASVVEAVTVDVSPPATRAMVDRWVEMDVPVPLRVLDSPYREVTRPVAAYVSAIRAERPRDLVVVLVPELVVSRWWERLLHNRSAAALKEKLASQSGVMIASVPWVPRATSDYPE
jgi:amino acid transporter